MVLHRAVVEPAPLRQYVRDDVIIATLPLLPPTLQAMIKLQRLTGMRPSEVFKMTVGDSGVSATNVIGVQQVIKFDGNDNVVVSAVKTLKVK